METAGTSTAPENADDGETSMDLGPSNILTIATCMFVGDIISQTAVERATAFEVKRAARLCLIGLFYTGPVAVTAFAFLEWLVGDGSIITTLTKVALSQCCVAPLTTLGFLVVSGALQRLPWVSIKHSVSTNYVAILKSSYVFWPAAEIVITQLAEVNHRPVWGAVASLFWNVYVSWKTNREVAPKRRQPTPAEKHRVE
ncbi:putative peroxisomal membrane protein 2, pxmp2 [Ixodes scapularis]